MPIDPTRVGEHIARLRKAKQLTQADLGERLQVSYQAVSKWERGETLPDTALLPDMAQTLNTTVDELLNGGTKAISFRGVLTAEAMICNLRSGYYLDRSDIRRSFQYEKWADIVDAYAQKHGIL